MVEVVAVLAFILFFVAKSRSFLRDNDWRPLANMETVRAVDTTDTYSYILRADIIKMVRGSNRPEAA